MLVEALESIAYDMKKGRIFNSNPEKFFELFPGLTPYEKKLLLDKNATAIETYLKSGENVMASAASTVVNVVVIVVFRKPHDEGVLAMRKIFDDYWSRVIGTCTHLSHVNSHA